MELKDLIERLKKFNKERDWDDDLMPQDISKALIIEAAELLEHFQWDATENKRNVSEEKDMKAIGEEIADVFIYTARLAYLMDFDLEETVLDKIKKNAKKYPA